MKKAMPAINYNEYDHVNTEAINQCRYGNTESVNQYNYASTEFILLSIINNKKDIVSDIHKYIIKYIEYVQIIKKTMANYNDGLDIQHFSVPNIQQFFLLYYTTVNNIKDELFGVNKNIFDDLMIKHKCTFALLFQNNIRNCDEAVIYVPDLFPTYKSDPIIDYFNLRMNTNFSDDQCDNFVIKNLIRGEMREHIRSTITWKINKCNHPLLNLLLSSGYTQCGVMTCGDYYLTGFLKGTEYANTYATYGGNEPSIYYGRDILKNKKKITLVTPKKNNLKHKSIYKIVKESITMMQNVKDNFGITTIPCYEFLCNDDVENFINERYESPTYDCDIINEFKIVMQNKKNNCYFEYKKAYDEYNKAYDEHKTTHDVWIRHYGILFNDADAQIMQYIHMKCDSKRQRERYNLNFYTVRVLI